MNLIRTLDRILRQMSWSCPREIVNLWIVRSYLADVGLTGSFWTGH